MKKLRVLIIGAAFSADLHSDGYSRILDKVDIVGICDRNTDAIKSLAQRYGFEGFEAYDDIDTAIANCDCDLVDICMPNFLHHDVAIKAMNAGRDIICEKPLATTVEDAKDMVDTAAKLGKHIYYAEDWLFAPAFRKAISLIESGQLGKMLYVRARECHSGSHSPFAQTIKYCGGGCMVHLGVHPVTFMLAMKDNKWSEISAMTSGGGENNILHHKMEGEDWSGAFMRFDDGTYATLEANYITVGGMEDILDVYCEKGTIHVDLSFSGPVKVFSIPGLDYTIEKAEVTTGWSNVAVDEKYSLGYCGEINHFVDCALAGKDAQVGLRGIDGYETLRVINLIYKSAHEGVNIKNKK
ncbi:MAG: Gfo/Idh/MocA family oxidoreductase [Clostridia bacterium]|nr:Gfo/Idh/MocA family oxidoreductase [Clostridia bacterium]MBO7289527.1 Gfo/Idh/MocA family oxidoreductase [Clostridia bacterium]